MRLQKDGNIAEAREEFNALFQIEVIQLRQGSGLPASVEKFRYLAYKNHGILLLTELQQTYHQIDDIEEYKEKIEDILETLTEALTYPYAEAEFLSMVFSIATALNHYRIARLVLEHITFSEYRPIPLEQAVLASFDNPTAANHPLIDPYEYLLLFKLRDFLSSVGDDYMLSSSPIAKVLNSISINPVYAGKAFKDFDFSWLTEKHDVSDSLSKLTNRESNYDRHVTLMTKTWDSIALSLTDLVSSFVPKGRKKSLVEDPYSQSKTPVRTLRFVFHDDVLETSRDQVLSEHNSDVEVDGDTGDNDTKEEKKVTIIEEPVNSATIDLTKDEEQPDSKTSSGSTAVAVEPVEPQGRGAPDQENKETPAGTGEQKRRLPTDGEQRARSSKRVKSRAEDGKVETELVDEAFFAQLTSFLYLCDADLSFESILPIRQGLSSSSTSADQYLIDFRDMLKSWDETLFDLLQGSDILLSSKSSDEGQIPVMQLLDFATLGATDLLRPVFESKENEVEAFVTEINNAKLNVQEVRLAFVGCMFGVDLRKKCIFKQTSWLTDFWPPVVLDAVRRTVELCENHLLAIVQPYIFRDTDTDKLAELYVAQSIFELFSDAWLGYQKKLRRCKDKSKAIVKDLELRSAITKVRLFRWQTLVGDLLSSLNGSALTQDSDELFKSSAHVAEEVAWRFEWASILTSPAHGALPDDMLFRYEKLADKFASSNLEIVVEFPNCSNIPKLSTESAKTQVSKYRAASIFAEIFDQQSGTSSDEDIRSRIKLLESILIPDEHVGDRLPEHEAILQFLSMSSQEFKLKLWYILLDAYDKLGENFKAFDGYLRIFCSTIDELSSPHLSSSESDGIPEHKNVFLLRYFNISFDIVNSLMRLLSADNTMLESRIPRHRRLLAFQALIKLLRLVYLAIVIDVPLTSYWSKALKKFHELAINCWCFFYFLYKSCIPLERRTPDVLNDILSIIHEDIGLKRYCSAMDGRFLNLILSELTELDWPESEADMLQCLHCRYDLALGNEDFAPYDHRAQSGAITRDVALSLVPFVVNMILRRKNISQTLSQNNVRRVVEQLIEALGDPDLTPFNVQNNMFAIEKYFDSMLTGSLIQGSLRGVGEIGFSPTNGEMAFVARKGLLYLMGLIQLNQFKNRKKTKELKAEDLEEVIKYFKYDLAFGGNRLESWVGLAQVYSSLVEDSLTWNADKLYTAEGKDGKEGRRHIGEYQRKAILACLMGITVHLNGTNHGESTNSQSHHYQQLSLLVWRILAETCYGACRPPMQTMEAFENKTERMVMGSETLELRSQSVKVVSRGMIMKLCHFALRLLMKRSPNDWQYPFFDAKVLHHLRADPELILSRVRTAIKLSLDKASGHDFIFEPHYKLVVLVYKYVKNGSLDLERGLQLLKDTPFSDLAKSIKTKSESPEDMPQDENMDGDDAERAVRDSKESSEETVFEAPNVEVVNAEFYRLCLDTLDRMRAADKKKWHHRPTYRMAEIYDDIFKDKAKAKELMANLINLKQSNKSPLNFWKPDFERPGHHFQFAYQYISYYLSLAKWAKDTEAISILARKVRRFSSGMVNNNQVWESLLVSVSLLVKEFLNIEPRFSDKHIATLVLEEFEKESKKLSSYAGRSRETELSPLYDALEYVADLRKINISFGSTSQLDDCFVSIYLLIYLDFKGKNYTERISVESLMTGKENVEAPATPKKTRVSRKEIIAKGTALVKTVAPIIKNRKKNVLPRVPRTKANASVEENTTNTSPSVKDSTRGHQQKNIPSGVMGVHQNSPGPNLGMFSTPPPATLNEPDSTGRLVPASHQSSSPVTSEYVLHQDREQASGNSVEPKREQ